MRKSAISIALVLCGAALLSRTGMLRAVLSANYIPHRFCYLAQPSLIWTNAVSDALIAASYLVIFSCLLVIGGKLRAIQESRPYLVILFSFAAFIAACSATHVLEVVTVWLPVYPLSAAFKVICMAVSVPTAIFMTSMTPKITDNLRGVLDGIKRARREQEDAAANYRGQIEAVDRSLMIVEFDMQGFILRANANILQAFDYAPADVLGKHHSLFVDPEYGESQAYRDFWADLRSGVYRRGLFARRDRHGNAVWLEATYNPVFDSQGYPAKIVKFATNVTERIAAQERLVETEGRLKTIVDFVPAGIIMIDGLGKIASANPSALKMFGYSSEELLGKNVSILMPEPDRSAHADHLARFQSSNESRSIGVGRELEGQTKEGGRFPLELSVTETSHRGERMFVGLVRDITLRNQLDAERNLHEKLLRKSERLLEQTNRLAGVGGWELDLITGNPHWADETCRILGAAPGHQPALADALDMYYPDSRVRVVEAIEHSASTGEPQDFEAEITSLDKRHLWIRLVWTVEWLEGKPARLVGAIQDITLRIEERLALNEATARAALATESGGIGIWDWNMETNTVTADALMCRSRGIQPEETRTDPLDFWSGFIHPDDWSHVERELRKGLLGDKPYAVEYRIRHRDGTLRFIESHGQALHNEAGKAVRMVGTNVDITARKRAEEATRHAQLEAEIANRAKSDFLANMSHEIRTPMNAIIGMTHLALRAHPSPQQQGYLNKIVNAGQSLLSIMNDILDFSKIEAGKLELERIAFPLDDVWRNLIDIVDEKAKAKGLRIAFQIAPKTPQFLMGDPLRLGQILINLVNNAIKFTDAGEVVVSVSAETIGSDQVRLTFSVRDTGIGMTPVQVAELFQSFHQGDSSYTRRFGGTGLGLAISRQLCALMGGSISVQSQVGLGSTFLVTVDLAVASTGVPIPASERTEAKQKLVLIVDDSEVTLHTLSSMLTQASFATREVSSGEEAVVALLDASQKNTPFDVVLMDWRLPKMDGMQTARRIREQLPAAHQPVILIISAFKRDEVFAGREESCCDGFMFKPIEQATLFEKIQGLLKERRTANPPKREARDNAARLAGKRVLLVEDNEINRELAGELLCDLGIRVTFAADGLEGVRSVAENTFDLVLMDIQMPDLDGLSATRQIRAMAGSEQLPIIAMTAHAMTGDRERSLKAGMNDHLTKPVTPTGLTEMLLRWMPLDGDQIQNAPDFGGSPPEPPEDCLPESLPPFNLKAALERTNNKPKLLRKMLFTFHKQYAGAAEQLRRQIAAGEHEAAHRLAHSLKGLAATLEASDLTGAAKSVESALRSGDTLLLGPLLDELELTLAPAITAAASLTSSDAPALESPVDSQKGYHPLKRSILLVVDDESTEFDLLSAALGADYQLEHMQDGNEALNHAAQNPPDVILLDVRMPGLDGYQVCSRLKAMDTTRQIPVIFITGANDPAAETRGLEVGGADYITKPFTPAVIRARIHNQIDLLEKQAKLSSLAATDALTGLANRRRFDEVFAYEYARHARSGKQLGLILLDVDFFKLFNDSHGHVAGDDCLRRIARALANIVVRTTDMIARYGGEEFALLMPETPLEGTLVVADKILATTQRLAIPHEQSTIANHVTVSLGAVSARCFPGVPNMDLLALVDRQLYAAKAAGRNCICAAHARFDENAREYVSEAFTGNPTAEPVPAGY